MKSVCFGFVVSVFITLMTAQFVCAATYHDTATLAKFLLDDYDSNVRPLENQNDAVKVFVQANIKSIQVFDEVKGSFWFVGALALSWRAENIRWDPSNYGGVKHVTFAYNDVLKPEIVLATPPDAVDSLEKQWNRIRHSFDVNASWIPADLIKSTCSVDVNKYPFDEQICVTSFMAPGFTSHELTFSPSSPWIDLSMSIKHTAWDLVDTHVDSHNISGGFSILNLNSKLKRKSLFVIINVALPIVLLSLLNVLVSLLVPESGERVSYSITVLLAIAVSMTIVSDMLHRRSEPVPLISYKLMLDMINSTLIVLLTVWNLGNLHKNANKPIPRWMTRLYTCLMCRPADKRYKFNEYRTLPRRPAIQSTGVNFA